MRSILYYFLIGIVISVVTVSCDREKYELTDRGITATIDSIDVNIQFYSPEIVRIVKSKAGFEYEKNSLSVIKTPEVVDFDIHENEGNLIISSEKILVKLNLATAELSFSNGDETPLFTEKKNGSGFKSKLDLGTKTYAVKQSFKLDPDEKIYGLGQLQNGKMSQRYQEVKLFQDNKVTVIPFFQSNKGYGLFWDNYSTTVFSDNKEETFFESEIGDCIDYYVMTGGDADGVIANMRDLTGQVPMFPYWTYGYWQSKERYKSQDETVGVVKKYRELGVPLDGIIQDWQYWGNNYHWNAMRFLNPEFPEPQKMVDQVHDMNAHLIISVWASFGPKTEQFKVLDEKDMLLDFKTWPPRATNRYPVKPDDKPSGVRPYDAYDPEARDIYWDYLQKGLFSYGIDGWWLDSTEPDHLDIKDEDFDNETYLGSYRRVRNAFPLMTVGGVYKHQREVTDDKRVFILTRSAFAGQQRYGANSWSGDVITDWDVLRKQISSGLNFSLTGIPYWNSDIGGFFVWNYPGGVNNKAFHEIYVRWLQFGTFCSMMRSHGTDTPREIWQFGESGDWSYDAIEKFINLRYRLLPYIYSVSWDVTHNASSMMRALVMDFVHDKNALDVDDEYMFGKSLLVAPVTEPMYVKTEKEDNKYINPVEDFSQIGSKSVYLPDGTQWFDFWTGEEFKGGQNVEKDVPIDIIPLYVKAGSILPMGPFVQYAGEKKDPVELRIYPGADGKFVLYEDEGDNYNYEEGAYSTIEIIWSDKERELTIGKREGEFPGMSDSHTFNVVVVEEGKGTGLEVAEPLRTVIWKGDEEKIKL
jgi:alpha-D-xyloside xylohydrolase